MDKIPLPFIFNQAQESSRLSRSPVQLRGLAAAGYPPENCTGGEYTVPQSPASPG
jgi:hypothetical protein